MKVLLRLCYLCNQDGENVPATHWYRPQGDKLDVCDKHTKLAKEANLTVTKIDENDRIIESY